MRRTPLFSEFAARGAKVVDFNGWALPVQFAGILAEHEQTRQRAGVFDCSHMGEFVLTGAESIAAFSDLTCSDYTTLKVGRARYSALLNESGGIVDDCVGLRLDDERLYLVTNAGPYDVVHAMLASAGAEDVTMSTAKIDVQGPGARDAVLALGLDALGSLGYWTGCETAWQGETIVVTRGGYTGELGYEIFVPNDLAVPLWKALLDLPDVAPCGLGARDTLRLEVGYPLNGEDLSPDRTPLESGMGRFVAWDSAIPGKAHLEAQRDQGGYPILVAVRTADRRAPRHGFEVQHDGHTVGVITSGTFGPSLGTGVGLARIDAAAAEPGTRLTAGPKQLPVEVASIPVYAEGTCRIKLA